MRTIFGSAIFWLGLVVVVLGSGPLAVAAAYATMHGDLSPNPVGLGILAFFTFWPGILLILIGLGVGIARFRGWIDR
jgi:hypothetical protein